MSIIGLIFLVIRAQELNDTLTLITFAIFGLSLIILYAASTIYHSIQTPISRLRWAIGDHSAIYLLIAGSYTPFTLITLPDPVGIILFTAIWCCAAIGMILKFFFTGRFEVVSTIMYVLMGWMAVFAFNPLLENLDMNGVYLLFSGGISYTVGALFFLLDGKLKFNHAIFHVFVLGGSFCHYLAIYFYVIPK
ncbi:MAG: hemolysin III [Paraglaciecola sp.]|jgi:hemolysin III